MPKLAQVSSPHFFSSRTICRLRDLTALFRAQSNALACVLSHCKYFDSRSYGIPEGKPALFLSSWDSWLSNGQPSAGRLQLSIS